MGIVQEKFQTLAKRPPDEDTRWTSAADARRSRADDTLPQRTSAGSAGPSSFTNSSMAGETDVSDNVNARTLVQGYGKLPMRGTDDQYTQEHVDPWYDDVGGFVERNNNLDRL